MEYLGLFQAAMLFREARLCELDIERAYLEETLPYWTVEAYKAAERAFRTVESEQSDPDNKPNADMTIRPTGSKAFANIEAAVAARSIESGGDLDAIERYFEKHEYLSMAICEYFTEATK